MQLHTFSSEQTYLKFQLTLLFVDSISNLKKLEGTARYAGLLLAPSESYAVFTYFRPLLAFSSNISNLK